MALQKDVSLGEFLRYERELRGITIEQVASATKVGVRTLHALEADHYSELPAKPFIRGFVTSYCRFIGLDSKDLLARFDDYINSKASERPNREAGHSGYAFEKRDGEQQSRTLLLVGMFGFVLVGGVAIIFLKPSFHHSRVSHVDKLRAAHGPGMELLLPDSKLGNSVSTLTRFTPGSTTSGVASLGLLPPAPSLLIPSSDLTKETGGIAMPSEKAPEDKVLPKALGILETTKPPEVKEGTQETSSSQESVEEPNPADPLDSGLALKSLEIHQKVIFKVLADIWVRYKVDNRPIRQFIIRKGNSLVLRAKEIVSVQVSNSKSVKFNYNSHGSKLMSSEKNQSVQQGGGALFVFPWQKSNKMESPFREHEQLPKTPDPTSEDGVI